MGKKEYCESELIALAGSLGHLYRLYACSTEAELREAIGDHEYDQLFQTGRHPSFHNVRTYCIQKMTKSVNYQRRQIGFKFAQRGKELSPAEKKGLAGACCTVVAT